MIIRGELAKNLKSALQKKNMHQIDLAKACNTSGTNISNYLRGTYLPPLDVLVEMAGTLDVTLDELCGVKPVQERGKEETLGDYARMIEKMYTCGVMGISRSMVFGDNRPNSSCSAGGLGIVLKSERLSKFIDGLSTMSILLKKRVIDNDIYQNWLDGQLRKFDEK